MEEYYTALTADEFSKWLFFEKREPFSNSELDKISNRLDIKNLQLVDTRENKDTEVTFLSKKVWKVAVIKFQDDWLIVYIDKNKKAWRCDGIRGLFKLLDIF